MADSSTSLVMQPGAFTAASVFSPQFAAVPFAAPPVVELPLSAGADGVSRFIAFGDVHTKWKAASAIMGHEFGRHPGVALSVGDFISPPALAPNHHVVFVHGNHDRAEFVAEMRYAGGGRFLRTSEAIARIAATAGVPQGQLTSPAGLESSGADYSRLAPGPARISPGDIIPTQEVVFAETIADYMAGKLIPSARPSVRVIDGRLYVVVGHHRIMSSILSGAEMVDVEVVGPSPDEASLGLRPVLHERHPDIKRWDQLRWRTGDKSGRLPQSRYLGYHPLFAGDTALVGGLRVAGVPGVFSPHFYESAEGVPFKYFMKGDIDAMLSMQRGVDILLMHEAPRTMGFRVDGSDPGNLFLSQVIAHLKPRLVLFGHHHEFYHERLGDTEIIGLDYPHRSYVALEYEPSSDRLTVGVERAEISGEKGRTNLGYQYPWQSGIESGKSSTVLFSRRIPMGREQTIALELKGRHYNDIFSASSVLIRARVPADVQDADATARTRAGFAINTAMPFAARYAALVEGGLDEGRRMEILGKIHGEMTSGVMADAAEDVLIAFQECLVALGLVRPKA